MDWLKKLKELSAQEEPARENHTPAKQKDCLTTILRQESVRLSQACEVPFTRQEIEFLHQMPCELVDKVFYVKEIFPGSEIIETDLENADFEGTLRKEHT